MTHHKKSAKSTSPKLSTRAKLMMMTKTASATELRKFIDAHPRLHLVHLPLRRLPRKSTLLKTPEGRELRRIKARVAEGRKALMETARKTTARKTTARKTTARKPSSKTQKAQSDRKKTGVQRKPAERKPMVYNAKTGDSRPSARYNYEKGMKEGTQVTYPNGEKKCLKLVGAKKTPKFLKCAKN